MDSALSAKLLGGDGFPHQAIGKNPAPDVIAGSADRDMERKQVLGHGMAIRRERSGPPRRQACASIRRIGIGDGFGQPGIEDAGFPVALT